MNEETGQGVLYVVATPIGNLGDITERAVEVLATSDAVFAEDTRRTRKLLASRSLRTPLRSLHEHNEAQQRGEVLELLASGSRVALVSDAGTPVISDPGRTVVEAALDSGFRVAPIPGTSAVMASLSVAGLPADRFVFLGFPPRSGAARGEWTSRLAQETLTTVVFESPQRLGSTLAEWVERDMGGRTCVLCRELTKQYEEVRRATVEELAEEYADRDVRGELSLVVAGASPVGWEELRPSVEARALELAREGLSTRDLAGRLTEEFDVPRNDAYEIALEAAETGESEP